MSDGTAPRSRSDSGELALKVGSKLWKVAAAALGAALALATPTIYVAKLPDKADVKTAVVDAIKAHEGKMAHHGVSGLVQRYAPSRVEFVHLKARVEQMERRNAEHRKEIKDALREIKASLRELSQRLPRRRWRRRP